MTLWSRHSHNSIVLAWEKNNNINPIKCPISSVIDSIGRKGRGILIVTNKSEKFIITARLYEDKNNRFGTSHIFSLIDVGDSLVKESHSRKAEIIKNDSKDKIIIVLYDKDYGMDYGDLPCIQ